MIMFIGILLLFLATVAAYHLPHNRIAVRSRQLYQSIQVCSENELTNGNRVVVDTPEGAVVVTKIMDKFFAVNAKCPHLGLPMKKGKIEVENNVPTITCSFHNSKFSLDDGKCVAWCTGMLGTKNDFIGGIMGSVGGEKNSPAKIYDVEVADGKVILKI